MPVAEPGQVEHWETYNDLCEALQFSLNLYPHIIFSFPPYTHISMEPCFLPTHQPICFPSAKESVAYPAACWTNSFCTLILDFLWHWSIVFCLPVLAPIRNSAAKFWRPVAVFLNKKDWLVKAVYLGSIARKCLKGLRWVYLWIWWLNCSQCHLYGLREMSAEFNLWGCKMLLTILFYTPVFSVQRCNLGSQFCICKMLPNDNTSMFSYTTFSLHYLRLLMKNCT